MSVKAVIRAGVLSAAVITMASGAAFAGQAPRLEITLAKRMDSHGSIAGGKGYIETVIEEFERQNPDIKVSYLPLTDSWQDKLTTQMIAGTAPDVFEMWGDFAVNWAESGMLLDLNPLVKRDFTAEYVRGFYPGQWDASVLVSGPRAGMRYGIPRYTNSIILFYNQDHFDRAGLETPHQLEQQKRWTWTTFLDVAKKAMQRDSDRVRVWGYQEYRGYQWVWSNGGKVFDYPANPTKFMLDQPEAVGGLKFLRSLMFDHQVSPPRDISVNFNAGQVAIATHWGSCCIRGLGSEIQDQFSWNIAPIPVGPNGQRVSGVFLDMWGIYSKSKHPEAAWRLVKFLMSPYAMGVAARMFGEQPAHITGVPQYLEAFKDLNARYAVEMAVTANVWPDAVLPLSKQVMPVVNRVLEESVFRNTKSVEGVLAEVRPVVEGIYAQAK